MLPRHILCESLIHLQHQSSTPPRSLELPGELTYGFHVSDPWRHLPHFRISRMMSARGPFFAWRLALDMERYISSFCSYICVLRMVSPPSYVYFLIL